MDSIGRAFLCHWDSVTRVVPVDVFKDSLHVFAALLFSSVKNEVIVMKREMEGYKKSNSEEQEKNEKLTMQLNWFEIDCTTSEKQISQKRAQKEAIQAHYSACLRTLDETTRTLDILTKVEANAASSIHGCHRFPMWAPSSGLHLCLFIIQGKSSIWEWTEWTEEAAGEAERSPSGAGGQSHD